MDIIATDRVADRWCASLAAEQIGGRCPTDLRNALDDVVVELIELLTADAFGSSDAYAVGTRIAALGLGDPRELAGVARVVGEVVDELAALDRLVAARRVAEVMGHLGGGLVLGGRERERTSATVDPASGEVDTSISRVFAHADVAVVLVDRDGFMVEANDAAARMGGYADGEIIGSHYLGRLSGRSRRQAAALFTDVVDQRSALARVDVRIDSVPNRLVLCSMWPVRATNSGQVSHIIVVGEDITDRRELNEELRRLAMYDPLTGLPNRAHLTEYLAQRVYPARSDAVGAMLFCDLVGFKSINDSYGHSFGDTVLRSVSVRMRRVIGSGDLLARLGGDEFVVAVARPTSPAEVDTLVSRLHRSLASPVLTPHGTPLQVTATIGFTIVDDDDRRQVEALMHDADVDMYRRRRLDIGGGRVRNV